MHLSATFLLSMTAVEKLPPGYQYIHGFDQEPLPFGATPTPRLSDAEHAALLALVLERGVARHDDILGGLILTIDYGGGTLTLRRTGHRDENGSYDAACLVHWPDTLPKYYRFHPGQPVCWAGEDPADVWRVQHVSDDGRHITIEPITVDDALFGASPGDLVRLDDEGQPRLPELVPPEWSDRPSPALLRVAERAAGRLPPGFPIPVDIQTTEEALIHVAPYVDTRGLGALLAYLRVLGEEATAPGEDEPVISAYIAEGQIQLTYRDVPCPAGGTRRRGFIEFWPYVLPESHRFYVNQPVRLLSALPDSRWRVLALEHDGFVATIEEIEARGPTRRLAVGHLRPIR